MYILFINSVGYVLFMTELESKFMNNNSDKKNIFIFPARVNNNSNNNSNKNNI